jgi:O-antigen/teichoic acid export membrane protein
MGTCFGAIQVRIPEMVALRTNGRTEELHRLAGRTLVVCCGLFAVGATALILVAPSLLVLIGSKTALPAAGLLIFFVSYRFLELHHSYFACVVMTENEVPFVVPALVSGVAIIVLANFLAPRFGIFGIMLATALVQAAYNNWWTVGRGLRGLGCSYIKLFRLGGSSLRAAL